MFNIVQQLVLNWYFVVVVVAHKLVAQKEVDPHTTGT